jgi:D-serine deaminase-like pyridoxal phosphate-dependent protein
MTSPCALSQLPTPAALVHAGRLHANIARMQHTVAAHGVAFRPHVKTSKCLPIVQAQLAAGAHGITVSTLKEAEAFFEAGVHDILYAVGIAAAKLPQVLALRRRGCGLKIITDNVATAEAIVAFGRAHGAALPVLLEIDVDGQRSGLAPDAETLLAAGRVLHEGGMQLLGVMAHAGASYGSTDADALVRMAEQERSRTVAAAERLRAVGLPCEVVSVGSTPTALSARSLAGVTEVRAGVYVFFDLVMFNLGVCRMDEIALSVLATVIGHQPDKGWAMLDAGWMALSRDRGTQAQARDFGYGQVCSETGEPIAGLQVVGTNQEHGIAAFVGGDEPADSIVQRLPAGSRVRILPNHACATAAQHASYAVELADGRIDTWPRFGGW